jgi:FkbM family methyltransferase
MEIPNPVWLVKRGINVFRGKDLWQKTQVTRRHLWLGTAGARWCICPELLNCTSVVYSFGVGEDISFDLELIRRFGVHVHAFDPTPRSIAWLAKQALPAEFSLHPFGVADFDGYCRFLAPENPAHTSYTLVERSSPEPPIELAVYRLGTIMKRLGHERIDLLKMDIEGAEYGVLSDLVASNIQINQLLVEFHHRWDEVGVGRTRAVIRALNDAGYLIFAVSPTGEEYGFVRSESAEPTLHGLTSARR